MKSEYFENADLLSLETKCSIIFFFFFFIRDFIKKRVRLPKYTGVYKRATKADPQRKVTSPKEQNPKTQKDHPKSNPQTNPTKPEGKHPNAA